MASENVSEGNSPGKSERPSTPEFPRAITAKTSACNCASCASTASGAAGPSPQNTLIRESLARRIGGQNWTDSWRRRTDADLTW